MLNLYTFTHEGIDYGSVEYVVVAPNQDEAILALSAEMERNNVRYTLPIDNPNLYTIVERPITAGVVLAFEHEE